MVHIKRMNESLFAKILKQLNVAGELVRSRQEEKQGLLDEFDQESKRFFFGKISERALMSSVKKTNKELARLDADMRSNIATARSTGSKAMKLVSAQAPVRYRATLSGTVGGVTKKKVKRVKKVKKVKRKVVKKKAKKRTVKKTKRKTTGKRKKR
ncbi:MAG TPA: hypothetical protein ENH99_00840 [Candidatus Pacearchaeota archaeon]|nr:hypothetical protein [Candidatus Pacearchaeota archaeon]